jgi:hypothetical protein
MTELIKYNAAKQALSEAKAVDEVRSVLNKALAMRLYAQQAKDKTLEADAAEIRARAERRVGEMMAQQPKATGTLLRGSCENPREPIPTLAEAGIDKKLAHAARGLAALPEDIFEVKIQEMREKIITGNNRVPMFKPPPKEPREPIIKFEPEPKATNTEPRNIDAELRAIKVDMARRPISALDRERLATGLESWAKAIREGRWP